MMFQNPVESIKEDIEGVKQYHDHPDYFKFFIIIFVILCLTVIPYFHFDEKYTNNPRWIRFKRIMFINLILLVIIFFTYFMYKIVNIF